MSMKVGMELDKGDGEVCMAGEMCHIEGGRCDFLADIGLLGIVLLV